MAGWDNEISSSSSSELDDEDEYCPRLIIDETEDYYQECHYETDTTDHEVTNVSDSVIDCTSSQSQNINYYQQNAKFCNDKVDCKNEVDSNIYNPKVSSVMDIISNSLDDSDPNYDLTADFELGEMLKDEFEALGITNVNVKDEKLTNASPNLIEKEDGDYYDEFINKDFNEIPQWYEKRLATNVKESKSRLAALKEVLCSDDDTRIHIEKMEQNYNTSLCRLDQKHPPFNKPWHNYWKFNCSMECKNSLLTSEHIHTIDCQLPILKHESTGVTVKNICVCDREFPSYVMHAVELFQYFLECSSEEEFSVQRAKAYRKSIWSYIELRCNYKKELMMIAYGKGVVDENIQSLKEFFENGPGRSTSIVSLFYVDEERNRLEEDSNPYFTLVNGSFDLKDKVGPIKISYDPGRNMTFNLTEISQLGETILQYLEPTNETTVLEIGCNSGAVSLMMARACDKVIGLDTSNYKVEKAELLRLDNGLQNVTFINCNPQDMYSKCLSFSEKCISVAILNLASPYGQSIDVMFALRKLTTIWRIAVYGSLTEEFHEKLKYLTDLNEIHCERFLPVRACILNKPPLFNNSFDILILFERKLLLEPSTKLMSTSVSLGLDEIRSPLNSSGGHLNSATKYSPGSKCEVILSDLNPKVFPNMAIGDESMDILETPHSLEFIDLVTPELQPTLNNNDNFITSTVNIKTDYGLEFTVNSHQSYFCQQNIGHSGVEVQKQQIQDYLKTLKHCNIVDDKIIVKKEPISGETSSEEKKHVNLEKKRWIEKLDEGAETKQEMKKLDKLSDNLLRIFKDLQKHEEVNVKKEDDIVKKFSENAQRQLQTNAMDQLINDLIEMLREEKSNKFEKKMIGNNLQNEMIVKDENSLTQKFSETKQALHSICDSTSDLLEKSQVEKLEKLQDKPSIKNFQKKVIVEEQTGSIEKVIRPINDIDQMEMLTDDQTDILQDNICQELIKNTTHRNIVGSTEKSTETKQITDKTNVTGLLKEDLQKLFNRRKEIIEQLNKDCEICCHVQQVFCMSLPNGDNGHCSLGRSRSLSRSKSPISNERDISMNAIRSRSLDIEETVKEKVNSRPERYLKQKGKTGWDSKEKVELPSIDLREINNRRKKLIYQNQNRHTSQLQQVLKSSPAFRTKYQPVNSVNRKLSSVSTKKIPLSAAKNKTNKLLVKGSKRKSILSLKHSNKYLIPLMVYKFLYPRLNPRFSLLSTEFYTLSHKFKQLQILQKSKFKKKFLLQQKKKQSPPAIQNFEKPSLASSVDSLAVSENLPNSISHKCNEKSSLSPRQSQNPLNPEEKKNDSSLINQTAKFSLESRPLSPESGQSSFLSKPKRSSNLSVTGKSQSPDCRTSEQCSPSGRSTSRSPSIIYVGSKSPARSRRRDSRLSSPASPLPHRSNKRRITREERTISTEQKKRTSLASRSRSSQIFKRFESPESESSSRVSSTSRKSKSPNGFRKRKMISANYRLRSKSRSVNRRSKSPSDCSERKRQFKEKSLKSTSRVSSIQRRSKSPVSTSRHRKTKSGPRLSSVNRKSNSPYTSRRQRSPKSRSRSSLINRRSKSPRERRRRSSKTRSSSRYRLSRSPLVSRIHKSRSRSNSFHSRSESPPVTRRWSHPSRSKAPIWHRFNRQPFMSNYYRRRSYNSDKYHWQSPAWKYKQSLMKYQYPTYHSKRFSRSRSRSSSSSCSSRSSRSKSPGGSRSSHCRDHSDKVEDREIRTKDNVRLYSPISP